MTDDKLVNRLKLMLGHAVRALEQDPPDMVIIEKLLGDALSLVVERDEPANPYADKTLRPGLNTVGEAAAAGMIAPPGDGVALRSVPHPTQEVPDV